MCALLGTAAVAFVGFHNANGHARVAPTSQGQVSSPAPAASAWLSGQLAIGDIDGTTVVNGDGTNLRLLSAPRSQVTFSPNGRQLTYLDPSGRIVSLTAATGQTRTIVRLGPRQWAYPRWSPNGRSLAYAFGTIPGPTSLATINPDGTNRHVIAANASPYFHWSPTGQWIAYTDPNLMHIWLVRPDGSDKHPAISAVSSAGLGEPDFSWSPDGNRIAFIAQSPLGATVDIERVDGTRRHPIIAGGHIDGVQWSPDGQSIGFLRNGTLVVRQLATGAETPVAHEAFAEQWSPDGRWISYLTIKKDSTGIGRGTVEVVSRDGTHQHQIAMLHKPEILVWGPSPIQ